MKFCFVFVLLFFFRNEPLSSLKLLVIAKELSTPCLQNEKFKKVIGNILKQPYWIHLYPELYHQIYVQIINVSFYIIFYWFLKYLIKKYVTVFDVLIFNTFIFF